MFIKNSKVYDILKIISRYILPALLTLFVTICQIWKLELPVEEIQSTVVAITSFLTVILNVLLGASNESYNAAIAAGNKEE